MSKGLRPVAWRWRSHGFEDGSWHLTDVGPTNPQDHIEYQPLYASNTLIEEQAARIAELEKEGREVPMENVGRKIADEIKTDSFGVSKRDETARKINAAPSASQARLSEAVKVLEWLDSELREHGYSQRGTMREKVINAIATLGENKNEA